MRYIALLLLLLTACASPVKLSDEGRQVRFINSSVATTSGCHFLGPAIGSAPSLGGGLTAARLNIMNTVGKAGGNAIAITSQEVYGPGHGRIMGDAYRCKF